MEVLLTADKEWEMWVLTNITGLGSHHQHVHRVHDNNEKGYWIGTLEKHSLLILSY